MHQQDYVPMAYIDTRLLMSIERRLTRGEQTATELRSLTGTTNSQIMALTKRMAKIEAEQRRRKAGFWMKLKMPPVSQIVIGGVASWVIGSLINAQIGKDGNPLEIVSHGLKLLELLLK